MASGDRIDDNALLRAQAELVRERDALGRSPALATLFDYLVSTSLEGRAPKEVEVADAVFAQGGEFDTLQDASVRVHAFRLRKRLDEFYATKAADQPARLVLLKGQYRIVVQPHGNASPEAGKAPPSRRSIALAVVATAAGCALMGLVLWALLWRPDSAQRAMADTRASPPWAAILAEDRPITVVVGDYYLFGEVDETRTVRRLVRDFTVNSRQDLDEQAMRDPAWAARYRDVGSRYYPVGIATAIRDILPILRARDPRARPPQIIPASALTPAMLRNRNIVYIGYFSALGDLRDPLFAISRFAVGRSYDELVDKTSGRLFVTDGGAKARTQDYGYLASFAGPNHNRIVIIAGTRDAALMQAADYAWQAPVLRDLAQRTGGAPAFEALWRVDTLEGENLSGRLLFASRIDDRAAWRGGAPQTFPDDRMTQTLIRREPDEGQ